MAALTSLSAMFAKRIESIALEMRLPIGTDPDAVALFDCNFRLKALNAVARKILGQPGQKLVGTPYNGLFRCNASDPALLLSRALECTSANQTLYVRAFGKSQPLAIRAVELKNPADKIESIFMVIKIASVLPCSRIMPTTA